jgi:hypothetical protein
MNQGFSRRGKPRPLHPSMHVTLSLWTGYKGGSWEEMNGHWCPLPREITITGIKLCSDAGRCLQSTPRWGCRLQYAISGSFRHMGRTLRSVHGSTSRKASLAMIPTNSNQVLTWRQSKYLLCSNLGSGPYIHVFFFCDYHCWVCSWGHQFQENYSIIKARRNSASWKFDEDHRYHGYNRSEPLSMRATCTS